MHSPVTCRRHPRGFGAVIAWDVTSPISSALMQNWDNADHFGLHLMRFVGSSSGMLGRQQDVSRSAGESIVSSRIVSSYRSNSLAHRLAYAVSGLQECLASQRKLLRSMV